MLIQCVSDECQLAPGLLTEVLDCIARRVNESFDLQEIVTSRYSNALFDAIRHAFSDGADNLVFLGSVLSNREDLRDSLGQAQNSLAAGELVRGWLQQLDPVERAMGALVIMDIACDEVINRQRLSATRVDRTTLHEITPDVVDLLESGERYVYFSACWALAWLGSLQCVSGADTLRAFPKLFGIWRYADCEDIRFISAWAIGSLPLLARRTIDLTESRVELSRFLKNRFSPEDHWLSTKEAWASLTIAYYTRSVWSDRELAEKFSRLYPRLPPINRPTILTLLKTLGKEGDAAARTLTSRFPPIEGVEVGTDYLPSRFRRRVESTVHKAEDIGWASWNAVARATQRSIEDQKGE
jgi:hypothetical protein